MVIRLIISFCILTMFIGNSASHVAAFADEKSFSDRKAEGFWKTTKAAVLDDPIALEKLRELKVEAQGENSAEKPKVEDVVSQISELLLAELSSKNGVHIETALTTLGSMAGFACQIGIREGFVKKGVITLDKAFVVIETKDNQKYYTGPILNECLTSDRQGQYSVFGIVGGALAILSKPVPDITEIFSRSARTLGSEGFAKPNIPKLNFPHQTSEELLWKYWNVNRNLLVTHQHDPSIWAFIFSLAGQQLIQQGKDAIDPTLAVQIFMEAAIPMSKIEPSRVHEALFYK